MLSVQRRRVYRLILKNLEIVEPKEKIDVVKDDPSGNIFVEAAVVGNSDYIVSQDKRLLKLKEFRKIITPEEFNKILSFVCCRIMSFLFLQQITFSDFFEIYDQICS